MRVGEGRQAREGTKDQTETQTTKGDQTRADPDKQTKQQTTRRKVPGWQRRTGAEKAAPITLE